MGACYSRDASIKSEATSRSRASTSRYQPALREELRDDIGRSSGSDAKPDAQQTVREPWEWTPVLQLRKSSRRKLSFGEESSQDEGNEITITFDPIQIGMTFIQMTQESDGEVTQIDEGGQAHEKGVIVGMRILRIGNHKFSEEGYAAHIAGHTPFTITFLKNDYLGGFDYSGWLEMAENGELDIYTCLGLSDGNSLTPDTQRLIYKIFSVSILQLIVPCVMLCLQLARTGLNFCPLAESRGFRIIGFLLYLYSLSSMYNNALDECRYRLLQFTLQEQMSSGYWWPLIFGELSNIIVSFVLVFTLFFIFTNSLHPTDLILNAVAVNFLGGVDAEFVDSDIREEAITNFKALIEKVGKNTSGPHNSELSRKTDLALKTMLMLIVCSGCLLAFVFLLAPSPPPNSDIYKRVTGMG